MNPWNELAVPGPVASSIRNGFVPPTQQPIVGTVPAGVVFITRNSRNCNPTNHGSCSNDRFQRGRG